jgi:hypothetical protein
MARQYYPPEKKNEKSLCGCFLKPLLPKLEGNSTPGSGSNNPMNMDTFRIRIRNPEVFNQREITIMKLTYDLRCRWKNVFRPAIMKLF